MKSQSDLERIIKSKFGDTVEYKDGLRVNCPFCTKPDSSHHLYICTRPTKYKSDNGIIEGFFVNCFRCGYSGTTQRLLNVDLDDFVSIQEAPKKKKISIFPDTIIPINQSKGMMSKNAKSYLKKRGVYDHSDIYIGTDDEWFGRIIFPITDKGKIVFWTGRSFIGQEPKYKNSSGDKGKHIFNLDKVRNEPQVVICEGVFDALSIRGGVALLGKKITEDQFWNFIKVVPSNRRVIVGLDPDASKEANALLDTLSDMYPLLAYVKMDGKDLAESKNYQIVDFKSGVVKRIT